MPGEWMIVSSSVSKLIENTSLNIKEESISSNKTNSKNNNSEHSTSSSGSSNSPRKSPTAMTALTSTQTEKPLHYRYLKEFRVEQCTLFPQHKCSQHRPFTCFNWHFPNQRRRRPVRKRDGTFNYSPDTYCTKYDEATGTCPDGDDCILLHRTAGDTERRYHLRYFKTCMCVYETDNRGFCTKNGAHCAFAHGETDKRPPVFDSREQQNPEVGPGGDDLQNGPNQLDKERNMMVDDPKWQDTNYVLAYYKTELCKRPPRLCRQGYACPQYHNERDMRRSPWAVKYRSTPCPNVRQGDEWVEPTLCEDGVQCGYCHTRTEQQFHPEIYKSSKCHDVFTNQYCPRGPFCAFAHTEAEMQIMRTVPTESNLVSDIIVPAVLPSKGGDDTSPDSSNNNGTYANSSNNKDIFSEMGGEYEENIVPPPVGSHYGTQSFASIAQLYSSAVSSNIGNNVSSSTAPPPSSNSSSSTNLILNQANKEFEEALLSSTKRSSDNLLNDPMNSIILGMGSIFNYTHNKEDLDQYSLFPSSNKNIREELKGDDSPIANEKDTDSEHFAGSDISSLSGGSKPVSIPSPGFFSQRERFPSGSSPMTSTTLTNSYNPLGTLFSKPDTSIDPGNDFLGNNIFDYSSPHPPPLLNNGFPPPHHLLPSQQHNSNSIPRLNGQHSNLIGPIGYPAPPSAAPGFPLNHLQPQHSPWANNIGNNGHPISSTNLSSSNGPNNNNHSIIVGNGRRSDYLYLSTTTLKQHQSNFKFQLELIEKSMAALTDKSSPHYPCLSCKLKDRYRSVVCMPCDHQVLCSPCAPTAVFCPLCRINIQNKKYTT